MKRLTLLVLASTVLLGGCGTLRYYGQAISGQLDIVQRAEPVERLLEDAATPAALRMRLALALEIRAFASEALGLPDNDSYRRYAALERRYAVWNVFAAPALSVTPRQWCFPILGCVAYRGYFDRAEAERFAGELAAEGLDVYVAGVPAFSTLGWFDDPLLSTFIHQPELQLAGLMFHELAHQQLYLKDDSAFSESFATVVELEGVRRFAARRAGAAAYEGYLAMRERREQFARLVLDFRDRLARLYASALPDEEKLRRKAALIEALRAGYRALRANWGGYGGYDAWFERPINNAQIASVGLYHQHVAALQALLAETKGDLAEFYRRAKRLSRADAAERAARLAALAAKSATP